MPKYVRVRDEDTGHERSVPESEVPHGNYAVLDEPATNLGGDPLPPKFAAHKSLSSSNPTNSGLLADTKKEKANG